jgi:VWFA-related protein
LLTPNRALAQKIPVGGVPSHPNSGVQPPEISQNPIHVRSFLVLAPATVVDASGNFVVDLGAQQFQVLDNGVPQRIAHFGLTSEPVAAVIVVQATTGLAPILGEVHPLGVLFSSLLLGQSGKAAVITFADSPHLVQDFSGEPEALARALRTIKPEGDRVRLNDALERAISMLARQTSVKRRIIIALCEGFDRGSQTTGASIVRAASDANVMIYGLRFNPAGTKLRDEGPDALNQVLLPCSQTVGENPNLPCSFTLNLAPLAVLGLKMAARELRANLIDQYSGYTGGMVYTHWKGRALQGQVQNLALQINSQYDLAYVPDTLKASGFHSVQIKVSEPGMTVRTRVGYFFDAHQQ